MPPITYPNQRVVRIHRESVKSDFLGIKNENWQAAARDLGPHGLRLYLYLASNANNYNLALSPAAARAAILYFGNMNPNKEHFGNKYIQVIYPTSISDYLTAKDVIKEAEKALSTITTDDQAEQKFGQLGRLCITDDKAVSETHDLDFIAANFSGDDGYMWVKYSSQAYDEKGENTYGSLDVLSRWELKKIKDEWTVISIDEHP